jgi:NodT family efflux transporter outer membrane factor (OMF) lipoprotein
MMRGTRPAGPSSADEARDAVRGLASRGTTFVAALALAGCTTSIGQWVRNGFKVGPNYSPPEAPVAAEWVHLSDPGVRNTPAQDYAWWTVFNDPVLNGLIDTAYRQNLDLRAAAARIMEARARRGIAAGNLFPQSQRAIAFYDHAQIGQNLTLPLPSTLNIWADGFNASWELDFWGRLRRNVESADANLEAVTEGYGDSLVLLLSEVATNYIQLRTFEQRLSYARENVVIQQKSTDLAQARFDAGTSTELDLRQAKASLAQTQATIPPLEAGRDVASNQLCVLLGMPVSDLAAQMTHAGIPQPPAEVAVGLPADLLRRRPDVRQAERLVAVQSAQIGIAEADFYPRLGVSGFIGYAADDFSRLFSADSLTGFILPTLQWNILNYGRIKNNVRAQEALLEATCLEYQQSVLTAGREVEDGLAQFIRAKQQVMYLEQSVAQARRAVEISQEQFQGGVADFNRVYTNQSLLVSQQDLLGTAQGNIALYLVQIYKAMGGGWEYFCQGNGMPESVPVAGPVPEVPPAANEPE